MKYQIKDQEGHHHMAHLKVQHHMLTQHSLIIKAAYHHTIRVALQSVHRMVRNKIYHRMVHRHIFNNKAVHVAHGPGHKSNQLVRHRFPSHRLRHS